MGNEEPGQEGQGNPVNYYAPQYEYGGQWFDDMGSMTLAFPDAPAAAFDVGTSGLSRSEMNMFAVALGVNLSSPYEEDGL